MTENNKFFSNLRDEWTNMISPDEKLELVKKVMCGGGENENILEKFDRHNSAYVEQYRPFHRYLCNRRRGWLGIAWHYCFRRFPLVHLLFPNKDKQYFKNGPWYYEFLEARNREIDFIKNRLEDIQWFYNRVDDVRSKQILAGILMGRITGDDAFYFSGISDLGAFAQYFDYDVISFADNEVYVDCGAYNGDTADAFIRAQKYNGVNFKKIYLYEPDVTNYNHARTRLQTEKRCVLREAGVGKENGVVRFCAKSCRSSHVGDGDSTINIVSLDSDINEPVTFIKMDIEGMEKDALMGARKHIELEHPKLAICIYHKPDDLVEIPRLIDTFYPKYKMKIRQYGRWNTETVLFCYE